MRQDSLIGIHINQQYEILEELGRGGMGTVYRARAQDGTLVALKVLRRDLANKPRAKRRFEREMQATAAIIHPNTVQLLDFGETPEGKPFLAMEYLDGTPLDLLIEASDGGMEPARVVRLALQIADGLAAAHAQGIIHRDLKPENIMVLDPGGTDHIKVLDFGIARFAKSTREGRRSGITEVGMIVGTPLYISPEQISGGELTHKVDLYLLGVLLYHMLTGEPPFTDKAPMRVLHKHVKDPIPHPASNSFHPIASWLDALVVRLLAKDPKHRPRDARHVQGLLRAEPTSAPAAPRLPPEAPRPPTKVASWQGLRVDLLLAVIAAFTLLGVIVAGVFVLAFT